MKLPKKIKQNQNESGNIAAVRRFFVRHGEKVIAGLIVITAVWIACRAWEHQPLSWQPADMERLANEIEETIKNNPPTLPDSEIQIFDYAAYAEQIRVQISSEFYSADAAWLPVLNPGPAPRGGVEVLTAESLRGEAIRQPRSTAGTKPADQWKNPSQPEQSSVAKNASIWVNLYGTVPFWQQWDVFNQIFDNALEANKPQYVYYELEKAEIKPKEELVWQPVSVDVAVELQDNQNPDDPISRFIPFGKQQDTQENQNWLLFSDFEVEPATAYAYRIRLYLVNPNYNLQEASVKEGVDTKSEFVWSEWSDFTRIYLPDRTSVQIQSVIPTDPTDFPRQSGPLRPVRGTMYLDYFDIELGQSLPLIEKRDVVRGTLCNMSKNEAHQYLNRGRNPDEVVSVNYPDAGLRSGVCVVDMSGGRRLQKRPTREAQATPDLFAVGKALLLMPDGTMQITTTAPELFR